MPGRNPAGDFHGERRKNDTHVAPHDPEAKLYRKAQSAPAKLHCLGRVLMEHRSGLPVDVEVTEANGFAEREAALTMLDRLPKRVRRTLAASPRTWPPTTPAPFPLARARPLWKALRLRAHFPRESGSKLHS